MRHGIRVGRLFGVDVIIDWSWFFIAAFAFSHLTWTIWQWHADWGLATCVATGLFGTAALFASILTHELGHALVASAQGMQPRSIRFFLFGAATHLDRERSTPLREALTAGVGPLISLIVGAGALTVGLAWLTFFGPYHPDPVKNAVLAGPIWTLLMWIGSLNVLLGLFNLLPAFPLDGGRIFRSAAWAITGDVKRATRIAAKLSQLIAAGMMGFGLLVAFAPAFGVSVADNVLGAIWLVFIGWFLLGAASHSYRHTLMEEAVEGVPVRRLMRPVVPFVDASTSVAALVDRWMAEEADRFVVHEDGVPIGVVDVHDARRMPRSDWETATVRPLARPVLAGARVEANADGVEALRRLGEAERGELLVVDGDRPVGVLRWREVMRWLELQSDEPGLWTPANA